MGDTDPWNCTRPAVRESERADALVAIDYRDGLVCLVLVEASKKLELDWRDAADSSRVCGDCELRLDVRLCCFVAGGGSVRCMDWDGQAATLHGHWYLCLSISSIGSRQSNCHKRFLVFLVCADAAAALYTLAEETTQYDASESLEKCQGSHFNAFTRWSVGRTGGVVKCRMRGPTGAAILCRIKRLENDRLVSPHFGEVIPAVFRIVSAVIDLANPVRVNARARKQLSCSDTSRIGNRQ